MKTVTTEGNKEIEVVRDYNEIRLKVTNLDTDNVLVKIMNCKGNNEEGYDMNDLIKAGEEIDRMLEEA